ncbi:hypothetical protein ACW910_24375 (plasmid) [Burkholderia ambifaria]
MTDRERMKSVILDWMGRHDVVLREQAFTTLLQMMLELEGRRTTPDREAVIDSILAKLDPRIRIGVLDEPYHSERNGLIMAWNVVASFKTAPNGEKGDS